MVYKNKDDFAIAWIKLSFLSSGLFCKQGKQLLSGLNGEINFHTLTALMGPSGAGKTTLLKCINMRTKEGLTADSKIYVNQNIPLRTCFIMQESSDHILMGLTVRESLLFASKIKNLLPTSVKHRDSSVQTGNSLISLNCKEENLKQINNLNKLTQIDINEKFDHKSNVENILKELLLTDCAENSVNDCSGGELKRLSVGLELVSKLMPNLLCIDEPTSGLDSNAAELVIQCLSQLSKCHRMAIVTSIHQPNSLLLNMFDQLYVLSKGGYCVFSGRPNTLRQHLTDCQINCTEDVLPIEFLLKISSEFPKNKHYLNENTKVFINNNVNNIDESSIEFEIQPDQKRNNEIDRLIEYTNNNFGNIFSECKTNGKLVSNRVDMQSKTFSLYHFYYLFLRGFTFFFRHQWKVDTSLAIFCLLIAFALIFFYGTDIGEESGCLSLVELNSNTSNIISGEVLKLLSEDSKLSLNTKFLFFSATVVQFLSLSATVLTFPQEIKIFTNEHQNRWYSTSSYFWSKLLLEISPTVVISYIYAVVVYFGTGQLNETHRFSYFVVLMFLAMFVAKSNGLLIGIIFSNNYQLAFTTSVAQNLFFILLGGFLLPINIQPSIIRGLSYTSLYNLIFSSVLSVIYGLDRCQYPNMPILLDHLKIDPDSLFNKAWYILGHLIIMPILSQIVLTIKVNNYNLSTIFKLKSRLKSNDYRNGIYN